MRPHITPDIPTDMLGQLRRHTPAYLAGALVLAGFQLSMNRIDWKTRAAIDLVFGPHPERVWQPASLILGLAVIALVTRVASRYFIFNAGRDVEYELRGMLLDRLHSLGAAFYRKLSAGEIMSRSTGDLAQVRLLVISGLLPAARSLACLRITQGFSPPGARLASDLPGSAWVGRVSHPRDDLPNFMVKAMKRSLFVTRFKRRLTMPGHP